MTKDRLPCNALNEAKAEGREAIAGKASTERARGCLEGIERTARAFRKAHFSMPGLPAETHAKAAEAFEPPHIVKGHLWRRLRQW